MSLPVATSPRPARPWAALVLGGLVVGLFALYPPFRVVRKDGSAATATPGPGRPAAGAASVAGAKGATSGQGAVAFSAPAFVEEFWPTQLVPAAQQAPELAPVLEALRRDPAAAAAQHARRVGLGNNAYLFARGAGRVTAVERSRVLVEVAGVTVALRTGPVFGNTLRDGCGLLDVNRAPGLAEFNALAAELNLLVEARVQPALRGVAVGAVVAFAGAADWPEAVPAEGPWLTFIPVRAEVQP